MSLTTKQARFLTLLREFIAAENHSPTLDEMRTWLEQHDWGEVRSLNSVKQYFDALEAAGCVRSESRKRGITLLAEQPETVKVPLMDSPAACGSPTALLDDSTTEHLEVSRKLLSGLKNAYAFRATGDSMDRAGIDDGDFVIIAPQPTDIRDGDLVLANIGECGTIKRFRRSETAITLRPESSNKTHKPIFLHSADEGLIVGKVAGILKQ